MSVIIKELISVNRNITNILMNRIKMLEKENETLRDRLRNPTESQNEDTESSL